MIDLRLDDEDKGQPWLPFHGFTARKIYRQQQKIVNSCSFGVKEQRRLLEPRDGISFFQYSRTSGKFNRKNGWDRPKSIIQEGCSPDQSVR